MLLQIQQGLTTLGHPGLHKREEEKRNLNRINKIIIKEEEEEMPFKIGHSSKIPILMKTVLLDVR